MSDDIARLIATFEAAIRVKPDYPYNLVGLAEAVAAKADKLRAFEVARRALAAADGDPRTVARARRLLSSLLPPYHIPMMNDQRRNAAWDKALRRAIRPGMLVFEIGTGAGMLALMAARAGAERVVTCESNPVAAAMARELAARNGFADRITVLAKRSQDVTVGADLARKADLLFCDIFADDLFNFEPFAAIADARSRLLAPGAPAVPAIAALRVALANWHGYARSSHVDDACGFDLMPMRDFVAPERMVRIGDGLHLASGAGEMFRFDLSQPSHPPRGAGEVSCEVTQDGVANGIARWIALALDDETRLEARPEPGAVFFSNPHFCPFDAALAVRAGERPRVRARYDGKTVDTWLAP